MMRGQGLRYSSPVSITHPHLVQEWHRSNELQPDQLTAGSRETILWECAQGHIYEAPVHRRTIGTGCIQCYNLRRSDAVRRGKTKGKQTLDITHPALISEWHSSNTLKPHDVTAGSHQKIMWECLKGHTWKAAVLTRTQDHGCPDCYKERLPEILRIAKSKGKLTLDVTHPDLANEWHISNQRKPSEVISGSTRKAIWKCSKDHVWEAAISSRAAGCGCSKCSYEARGEDRKRTTTEFVDLVRIIHGERYDYSLTIFDGVERKVTILCPEHGPFQQRAHAHLNGHGCQDCGAVDRRNSIREIASKVYILTSPKNVEHTFMYWPDLTEFCKINGLSQGTFESTLSKNWPPSRKGKNAGWSIVETDRPAKARKTSFLTEEQQKRFENIMSVQLPL